MRHARSLIVCFLLSLLPVRFGSAAVHALVVGADYRESADRTLVLANTLIDANAIVELFRDIDVASVRFLENPDGDEWKAAIDAFAATLGPADIAVLYYAGHAVQVEGENFFLAGDGAVLVSAEEILSVVMQRARGSVFTIDACRNNPFQSSATALERVMQVRAVSTVEARGIQSFSTADVTTASGLSQMNNVRGRNAVVLFSTEPGNVAVDGEPGKGSPFANVFVRELARRQSLDTAIRRITAEVDDATDGRQSPWRQGDVGFPLFLAGQPRFPVP